MVYILEEIEMYAKENKIPIMQKDGIEFMTTYIKKHHFKRILEIGCAIGYSAIKMALIDPNIQITTIERDEERYHMALKNIKRCHLENQIEVLHKDALDVELGEQFDFIFIDAAKGQYIPFFEKFEKNLVVQGVIISDNLKFHGLVEKEDDGLSRNVRGIVRKLRKYIEFLKNNDRFETQFFDIGDGISISLKIC